MESSSKSNSKSNSVVSFKCKINEEQVYLSTEIRTECISILDDEPGNSKGKMKT